MEKRIGKGNTISASKKMLLPALLMLLVAVLMLAIASWAWFAMNKEVSNDGMTLSAETPPNLIIDFTSEAVAAATPSTAKFSVTSSGTYTDMKACTHDDAVANTKLMYVTNPQDVSMTTGVAKDGKTLTSSAVDEAADSPYYVDFVVYIASMTKEMTNSRLKVTLSDTTPSESSAVDIAKAATVDFYVNDTVNDTYVGKLAVAGGDSFLTLTLADNKIPLNTEGQIKVTMRCYFDGALEVAGSSGITYVRTETCNANSVNLKVVFEAEELNP
ncbi:MAG: hypothetical protein IJU20_07390 [Clostridia bacterium]|nr:hypothetical protein [Clostridia bacterium]